MSRSGYSDDCDGWELVMWRGAVNSAIRGKRGQAFLREMAAALDAMPLKELHANVVVEEGQVCAIGSVAVARGLDVSELDIDDRDEVAKAFGVAPALAAEIAFMNDDDFGWKKEEPAARWQRMRKWVDEQLLPAATPQASVAEGNSDG